MPVVASNRGLKTGNTDDQYKQIYKRVYNHVIKKGKAAALDPIPEGLGSAYVDAFRHGKEDASTNGASNFQNLLSHRVERFKAIGIRTLQEECEKHCLQLAHKWLYDVFGHRARGVSMSMLGAGASARSYGHGAMIGASGDCSGHMQRGFGGAGEKTKAVLEQKLEDKYKQLMKEMETTRKWNSYMTDDLRRAERDCLELIEDEPSRQAVHAALEKARKIIETYHDKAKKAKLKADAAAAYTKLKSMLDHMRKVLKSKDTKFQRDNNVKDDKSLNRLVRALKVTYNRNGYAIDPDAAEDSRVWPNTDPTLKFFSRAEIDDLVDKIYQDATNTYSTLMLLNKFEALAYLYVVLTKYRRQVVTRNSKSSGRTIARRRSILGTLLKPPPGNRLTLAQKAALAAKAAQNRKDAAAAEQKRVADAKADAEAAAKAAAGAEAAAKAAADAKDAAAAEQKRVADAKADADAEAAARVRAEAAEARLQEEVRVQAEADAKAAAADAKAAKAAADAKAAKAVKNLVAMIRQSGKYTAELQAADKLFNLVDKNRDEFITKRELRKALRSNPTVQALFQSIETAFKVFDRWPNDKKISRDELIYVMHNNKWQKWNSSQKGKDTERKRMADKAAKAKADAADKQRLAKEKRVAAEQKRKIAEAEAERKRLAKAKAAADAEAAAKAAADAASNLVDLSSTPDTLNNAEPDTDKVERRKQLALTPARQQKVKEALEQAMKNASRDTTLGEIYCEMQQGVMCLQHSINNIVGQSLFVKADFFNKDDGENGYKKEQLDKLLKDNAVYTHASDAYNRWRNRVYMREPGGQGDLSVLTEQELEHVVGRKDFLGLIVGKPGHWVAVKRVIIGGNTVYVKLDSVGQKRDEVATDANSLHNYINAEGNGFIPTVDVVYAWSGYEYLEHELTVNDALRVLTTYGHDFQNDQRDRRAKINFEFIVLGVSKDRMKSKIDALGDTTHKQAVKVFIEHLQELYQDINNSSDKVNAKLQELIKSAAQAVAESLPPTPVVPPVITPVAPPVITPVVTPANPPPSWQILQPDALSTSMSDAFAEWMSRTKEESESEDSEGEEEEETWEPMQEAMETALAQGWAAWRRAEEARASGAATGNSTKFMALPEAPTAAPTAALPSPLRFMDHADATSYFSEGAPPSPPRVMIR